MSEVETKKDTENATQVANDEPLNRVNGKTWKPKKGALRIRGIGIQKVSWEKKVEEKNREASIRAKIKEMKDEKESARKAKIAEKKSRIEAKEEKERLAKLAEKLSAKRIARLKRKEKRNKMLKER